MVSTAAHRAPKAPRPVHAAAGPPPRKVLIVGGIILLAVVLIAVLVAVVWRNREASVNRAGHTVSGPVGGREDATLDLLTGVTAVTVTGADLGDVLYRVRTPESGPAVPSVTVVDGRVGVQVHNGNDATVNIELNRDVRWTVRFTAGAASNTTDLRGVAKVGGVEYIGGVSAIELSLPAPKGTLPVRMTGGASSFRLHLASAPVRVRAGGGAGAVTVDGTPSNGVGAGSVIAAPGWDTATDRYDVDNTGGVGSVTVDRY